MRIGGTTEPLVHYSAVPVRAYVEPTESQGAHKPMGLWVGVGEAWREWCEYEDWDPGTLGVRHVVELTPEANVLVLETPEELDQFTARFGIQTYPDHLLAGDFEIDWEQVKNVHQGLIIAPYQWTRRHALYWYYGWDCASGCIWDENAIYAIREVTA